MVSFGWWFPEDPTNSNQWDKSNLNILIGDDKVDNGDGLRGLSRHPVQGL